MSFPPFTTSTRREQTSKVARAQVLLVESIHASAKSAFVKNDISVHRVDGGLAESELIERLSALPGSGPVMLGIRSKTRVTARVLESVPRLHAVGAFCIGTDQIDLEAAQKHAIAVFNAPFSNTRSVAELVLGEIIMLSRQVFARSTAAHRGEWAKTATGAHEVRGKTLGIVGYGHIGSQLSVLAEAMGLRVCYHDVISKLPLGNASACSTLNELLGNSDFVSLHVPDTELTRNLIGAAELRAMKAGAYLINASRGQVVDIPALKQAIDEKHIAGAAIDVFPKEPASTNEIFESPLRGLEQVILTPHIGGSTQEAQANIGREVSGTLASFMRAGSTLGNLTLPELDLNVPHGRIRLINIHRNVTGAASAINRCIAESELNIEAQQLATRGSLGMLTVDVSAQSVASHRSQALIEQIDKLPQSIRTRIVEPA